MKNLKKRVLMNIDMDRLKKHVAKAPFHPAVDTDEAHYRNT